MSYTPTEWATGDVITAEKLNNMEDGIVGAGGVLVMNATASGTTSTLDKKCSEIKNAITAGKSLMCRMARTAEEGTVYASISVVECEIFNGGGCSVGLASSNETIHFVAPSDNDYPTYTAE